MIRLPEDLKPITPREFCRIMNNLQELPMEEILEQEREHGYRKQCIILLSKVLKVSTGTIKNWGKGIDFKRIPEPYTYSLGYYLEYYLLKKRLNNKSLT
jgi:hypothetical protein